MSTNALKLFAVICMVIDHIGEFYPDSPIYLRYIGRLAAPIFFYCSVWGLYYTHNQRRYIIRLYILSIMMAFGNLAVTCFLGDYMINLNNNIFQTLFLGSAFVYLLNKCNTWRKKAILLCVLTLQQALSILLGIFIDEYVNFPFHTNSTAKAVLFYAILGSALPTEGGIVFILFFVGLYYLKDKKIQLSLFFVSFTLIVAFLTKKTSHILEIALTFFPFSNFQWLMILSLPLILLYNGKKGKSMKWFYYAFYPLHIWILCIISHMG